LSAYNPLSVENIIKQIIDRDRYVDVGRAMKIRCEFVQMSHMFMPEFCKVANRKTVVNQAYQWSISKDDDCGFKERVLRDTWSSRLRQQVEDYAAEGEAASELIFQMIDDDGFVEKANGVLKQKMALCLIYAIWKEREEEKKYEKEYEKEYEKVEHITRLLKNQAFSPIYTQENLSRFMPQQASDPSKIFAEYIKNGKNDFTESISPWVAFEWVYENNGIAVDNILDPLLKAKVKRYKNINGLTKTKKRVNENSFLLNLLRVYLVSANVESQSKALKNLLSNILGVHDWGICLDKTFLSQTTSTRVADVLLDDQNKLMQDLQMAERAFVSTGVSELCISLENEFLKRVTPRHVAEGAVPLIFTYFIRNYMLHLSATYSPPQLKHITRYLINGLSPILFASSLALIRRSEKTAAYSTLTPINNSGQSTIVANQRLATIVANQQ